MARGNLCARCREELVCKALRLAAAAWARGEVPRAERWARAAWALEREPVVPVPLVDAVDATAEPGEEAPR